MPVESHLRRLRRARDWTQEQIAAMLTEVGCKADRQKVSAWERGLHLPSSETMLALGYLFKMHADEIFEFKPQ